MLKEITCLNATQTEYPFNILKFDSLDLSSPVIFLTGENGCGKSTLLNAISTLTQSIPVGKASSMHHPYEDGFKLSWSSKLKKGYYFQSEDFYTYLSWASDEVETNQMMLQDAQARHKNPESLAYLLETNLHKGNTQRMNGIVESYLKASHGEGYIRFFSERLRSQSLYLLDEPETPLSFQNQLTLLYLIGEYVKKGSQFIICTHSPILLAYPQAKIYYIHEAINEVSYDNHPIVSDTRSFLKDPQRFMHYLFNEEGS
ncbi:hypothetical protein AOC36_05150 [Erysipelothrix larvae]|uniref:AAA+ ATPase domain-containing protein n=1 Tax=Erysipelothrix larvae TaxID=1514105 RepID=A0A0X8GZM5_9FIRM|nr:ATP-binding cassette domain-containing protein [Erysipelothrix larvae]AMC93385.1 hypothetical protein AOC36_05150 [Erysipelothrix larvae]